jgi:hypothetical protein
MTQQSVPTGNREIVAKAYWWYLVSRFTLVAILIGYGIASLHDGFWVYPAENQATIAQGKEHLPHPGFDVQFNKAFGVGLPPLGIAFGIFAWYTSRGKIRFDGTTLSVPGHPPVPLTAIQAINRTKWERKGIVYLRYQIPGTTRSGTIKLDDFVYERAPIDEIYKQISTIVG